MDAKRRAGEPETRGPAGAPAEPPAPAGAPHTDEPEAEQAPPEEERAKVERDLDELLAETKRERDEYLELAQRARADFENYRKRAARDVTESEQRARAGLVRELVPVLDNLERALRTAGVDPEAEDAESAAAASNDGGGLAHGVVLVYRDLRATLERAGVEAYDPHGEAFDPAWHEALATRAEDGAEAGVVLETVEKGYRLDGQLLRAARVIVSE